MLVSIAHQASSQLHTAIVAVSATRNEELNSMFGNNKITPTSTNELCRFHQERASLWRPMVCGSGVCLEWTHPHTCVHLRPAHRSHYLSAQTLGAKVPAPARSRCLWARTAGAPRRIPDPPQ
ncbi:hypothetical protein HBI56_232980 [Parastagonospora nodorum]|uniref:Uncharacterized protein n=1 Tax=Phaeosphaeria nodorum (strain SN15 / ATCC MYA-4574 / FGSC 10173) TaxID=321614 RepID=A0A7U2I3V2_PHANO|nr:hypothetical protein HBH56_200880 [Parastagonospora nodorum]QRD00815.1 hypothetical protein JI435_093440 [Parastagonospora nodorum SN15]KAH3925759.1 hypothetical protein HBH54_175410 [Parastagonospora nodorum]KAH3953365.1 hypothetical protein HBH53_036800 [Parastagonospora nodorum]KAH3976483.1 hypothetical protein HBH52_121870 [Parastagonospora nodorum]